jgi:hypothetical protein
MWLRLRRAMQSVVNLFFLNLAFRAELINLPLHLRPEIPVIDKAFAGALPASVRLEKILRRKLLPGRNVRRREPQHRHHPVELL